MSFVRRWAPAAALMLVSIISYVDRNTLALLSPVILKETGLSMTQFGLMVSAYSIAFMIGNPIWGFILDRVGLRRGMTSAVAIWSLASVAHAYAGRFFGFAAARAVLGFGEGAAAPGGLRTVAQTLPPSSRARGIALTYSGGSAGAILTPIVIAPIAARFGWRGAFEFTGVLGALWIALFFGLSRRDDLRAPSLASTAALPASARPRFDDPRLLGFLFGYALGALPLGFVVYCSALYLNRVLAVPQARIGALLWIPPLGSELGVFFWGWLGDRVARVRADKLAVANAILPWASLLSLPLALLPTTRSLELALLGFFFAMFVAAAFQVLVIAYASEAFAREHLGYVAGIGSGAYGAGLALTMPLFGKLFDASHYGRAFLLAGLCPMLGYGCFRLATSMRDRERREQRS